MIWSMDNIQLILIVLTILANHVYSMQRSNENSDGFMRKSKIASRKPRGYAPVINMRNDSAAVDALRASMDAGASRSGTSQVDFASRSGTSQVDASGPQRPQLQRPMGDYPDLPNYLPAHGGMIGDIGYNAAALNPGYNTAGPTTGYNAAGSSGLPARMPHMMSGARGPPAGMPPMMGGYNTSAYNPAPNPGYNTTDYERGYKAGHSAGHTAGYNAGSNMGYISGSTAAHNPVPYEEYHTPDFDKGYQEGYYAGYPEGVTKGTNEGFN